MLAICAIPFLGRAQGTITTVAGNGSGTYSGDNVPALQAGMNPYGVAVDQAGNIYIADVTNYLVRKVDTSGIVHTVAGCLPNMLSACIPNLLGNGGAATSAVVFVYNVAVDSAGNLYIADSGHSSIRKVTPGGTLSTVAGNGTQGYNGDGIPALSAELNGPNGLAVDAAGNIYIADVLNNRIRKVDPSGTISTVAGNGNFGFAGEGVPGGSAELSNPQYIALDSAGNLYISDSINFRVRKLTAQGIISTVAGNGNPLTSGDGGPALAAGIAPLGIAVDGAGNIFISQGNSIIRKIDTNGNINTIAGGGPGGFGGDNGPSTQASLLGPNGLTTDAAGNLYVADTGNNRVRKIAAGPATPPYTCTNTAAPVISSIDSASAYGGYTYFASGSWLEIKGSNLADPNDPRLNNSSHSGQWGSADFSGSSAPTKLDGISVSINGKPAYVWYLSPTQLNVEAPEDSATGNVSVTVTNCKATSSATQFARHPLAPGLLAPSNYSSGGTQYMVATFQSDGAYVLNAGLAQTFGLKGRPAKPGDLIIAYGVGFGDVTPSILPGTIVSQANALVNPVTFSFGSTPATLSYSGLAGSFVGLYEFYITVPAGLANGDYQIHVAQNGTALPQTMFLSIQN